MTHDKLRSGLIRLAASNPELRADLLPLLKSAKGPAEKTAGLSKVQILSLAKDALGNEKLAKIVVSVLTKPVAWKFTKNWDEQTWKDALLNNAKNYEGLASDE